VVLGLSLFFQYFDAKESLCRKYAQNHTADNHFYFPEIGKKAQVHFQIDIIDVNIEWFDTGFAEKHEIFSLTFLLFQICHKFIYSAPPFKREYKDGNRN
jgi:hypothetical protein